MKPWLLEDVTAASSIDHEEDGNPPVLHTGDTGFDSQVVDFFRRVTQRLEWVPYKHLVGGSNPHCRDFKSPGSTSWPTGAKSIVVFFFLSIVSFSSFVLQEFFE